MYTSRALVSLALFDFLPLFLSFLLLLSFVRILLLSLPPWWRSLTFSVLIGMSCSACYRSGLRWCASSHKVIKNYTLFSSTLWATWSLEWIVWIALVLLFILLLLLNMLYCWYCCCCCCCCYCWSTGVSCERSKPPNTTSSFLSCRPSLFPVGLSILRMVVADPVVDSSPLGTLVVLL